MWKSILLNFLHTTHDFTSADMQGTPLPLYRKIFGVRETREPSRHGVGPTKSSLSFSPCAHCGVLVTKQHTTSRQCSALAEIEAYKEAALWNRRHRKTLRNVRILPMRKKA